MNTFHLFYLLPLFSLSESASLRRNDTLDLLQKDVADVGSAVETFTFDILRQMLTSSEENATTTVTNRRRKRSAEDDVKQLCQRRCEEAQRVETQQIKDLKSEVTKLKDMVKLLQDQQKVIDLLDQKKDNVTKQIRAETEEVENEELSNSEQLAKMKKDLNEAIQNLNQTREIMELQKQKDEILEDELVKQKEEISKLKLTVEGMLHKNETVGAPEDHQPSERASDSTIRKLLKSLPDDDDDDDTVEDRDLAAKLVQIKKELNKKRRQQALKTGLRHLEKGDGDLVEQIINAIKKTDAQGRNDDLEVNKLSDLQEAINRLRPKENEADQFQAMLTKLINKPGGQASSVQSQFTISAQQMSDLTKKLTSSGGNLPYICVADDGGIKNRAPPSYRQVYPPPDYGNQRAQQFFPGQYGPPNYYPQGVANGAGPDKPGYYQGENGDVNQRYQDDLRQQIDGLQAAVDSMNRPEYLQRPEDKAIVDDLERQIGDLRNIVNNLNYDQMRNKRSLDNNEIEDDNKEVVTKMSNLVNMLKESENPKTNDLANIQEKIDKIKNKLDSTNPNVRAPAPYDPPVMPQIYSNEVTAPSSKSVKQSFKNDFFAEVIGKILDKLISAIPVILQKVFSFSFQELSRTDYQDYDVQVLFKNLGIFAYLPVILLRVVRGISAFMNMLRKNNFFKNFLMPAIILGTVAGSVLFLIWWLQPDDSHSQYNYLNYDTNAYESPANQNTYTSTNPQYPATNTQYPAASYNAPVYSRSYFNK